MLAFAGAFVFGEVCPSVLLNVGEVCSHTISLVTEIEALTINDRDLTDDQSRWHSSVMATIIRQANELTYIQINKKK